MNYGDIARALSCRNPRCICHKTIRQKTGLTHCPAHDDANPSLSLTEKAGKVLWSCKAGCSQEAVQAAFPRDDRPEPAPFRRETRYEVKDAAGHVLATHVRVDSNKGKDMWWEPRGTNPRALPLWRWWELPFAPAPGTPLIITEGEKAAEALAEAGWHAVGTYGSEVIPEASRLAGIEVFTVYLWPDNDTPGHQHMASLAEVLQIAGVAPRLIRWVEAPPKGDAYDYINLGYSDIAGLLASAQEPQAAGLLFTRRDDDVLTASVTLPSGPILRFDASEIRTGSSGTKATVAIHANNRRIGYSQMAVDDAAKRVTLTNASWGELSEMLQSAIPKSALREALEEFCYRLRDEYDATLEIRLVAGAEDEPVAWVQNPHLIEEAGTIIYSEPGSGKTFTGLGLAITIHHGISQSPWGFVPRARRVLYVNLERSEASIARRLGRMNLALGLPRESPLAFISGRGRTLQDVIGRLRQAVQVDGYEVIILDSISRSGEGTLNADDVANRIMDQLNSLRCAWLALAHQAKSATDQSHSIFGSQHFKAAADLTFYLRSDQQATTLNIVLEADKANDTAKAPPRYLVYEFDEEFGIKAVRRTSAEAVPALSSRLMTQAEQIASYLKDGPAPAEDIAEATGITYGAVRTLLARHTHQFVRTGKDGRKLLYGLASSNTLSTDVQQLQKHVAAVATATATTVAPIGVLHVAHSDGVQAMQEMVCTVCKRSADRYNADGKPICLACDDETA